MELTQEDILLAQTGEKKLREAIGGNLARTAKQFKLSLDNAAIALPRQVVGVVADALGQMAQGKQVTVTAQPVEMTTQQAAAFLRVSRPFLIGLLEKGAIPHRKVGTHRRVLLEDLQAYKEQIDAQRRKTLEALTAQAQELNMGY